MGSNQVVFSVAAPVNRTRKGDQNESVNQQVSPSIALFLTQSPFFLLHNGSSCGHDECLSRSENYYSCLSCRQNVSLLQ